MVLSVAYYLSEVYRYVDFETEKYTMWAGLLVL